MFEFEELIYPILYHIFYGPIFYSAHATHYMLLTTHDLLPTTHDLLPTTCDLLPTTHPPTPFSFSRLTADLIKKLYEKRELADVDTQVLGLHKLQTAKSTSN